MAKVQYYGTGRRKNPLRELDLFRETEKIIINERELDDYFGLETLKPLLSSLWC